MSYRFLDNLTLTSLIAPIGREEFESRYWERQPVFIPRNRADYYGDLFTLHDFDEALTRSPSYVKIANNTTKKNGSYKGDSAGGLDGTLADMREGCTLVLDHWHQRDPKLGLLCRVLAQELGHAFQTNLYLTPPHGRGFPPHWDNHDVFILQVVGSKHWKIEKDRRAFPEKHEVMEQEGRELRGELHECTIKQGDLIYIPRGYVHAAECGDEPSLHITLGVTGLFWDDLLRAVSKAMIRRDPSLREALPLGFLNGKPELLLERLASAVQQATDKQFLASVVEQFRDELVKAFPIDVSGQIETFFRPVPLSAGDIVGPRRGVVFRLHDAPDSVRVNVGGRTITFLEVFRDALRFALEKPTFAIRELPGELEDEERIVFIERLMQEGLVVRKPPQDAARAN
jgi:bifunctional lysine-specific demethylase and histidyl-hydroxylase MINA